jgi:putative inorganic carbon (hco3(-)) transporter
VAGLIWRLRIGWRPLPTGSSADLWWAVGVGGAAALVVGAALQFSIQAAFAFVLVMGVVALYEHDRALGVAAMFTFWLIAPFLRRVLALLTGTVENDPLSLAPYVAVGAIAALEFARVHVPRNIRTVVMLAAAGFAIGLPLGFTAGPGSAAFAFGAYVAGVTAAVLAFREGPLARDSTLRRVLLYAMPVIAVYAICQRYLPRTPWDDQWLQTVDFLSIGSGSNDKLRVFGTVNSPGTLGGLLGLALLCYLTVTHHRMWAILSAAILVAGLSLTSVRSSWYALVAAGLAHVVASRGQSARLILGSVGIVVAAAIALSPVNQAATETVHRFETIAHLSSDRSATDRKTTFRTLFPKAVRAPLGHGLGSAGESTKLNGQSDLRAPDNGYLSLMYQVGPVGFTLVMIALGIIFVAAWNGARERAPGQDMRLLLFAMLVYILVLTTSGDAFYGVTGAILWFIGGQVLAHSWRSRSAREPASEAEPAAAEVLAPA